LPNGLTEPQEIAPADEADFAVDQNRGDDLEARLTESQAGSKNAQSLLNQLTGQVVEQERNLPDVVGAEECFDQTIAQLERVESLEKTLEITLRFLKEARDRVQRDIAPHLAMAVQDQLPAITANRYHEVLVDPANLRVTVRPRGGEWRAASLLSHGTSEQIYLLLRLAVAKHLVKKKLSRIMNAAVQFARRSGHR
jgi:uncharacterized protein YhaN